MIGNLLTWDDTRFKEEDLLYCGTHNVELIKMVYGVQQEEPVLWRNLIEVG